MSRSRTANPVTKEDLVKLENMQTIDEIFGKLKSTAEEKQSARETQRPSSQTMTQARPTADLTASSINGPTTTQNRSFKDPTEVLLYGFGSDYQYAAIEFYETASKG